MNKPTKPLAVRIRDIILEEFGAPMRGSCETDLNGAIAKLVGRAAELTAHREFALNDDREWAGLARTPTARTTN